MNVYEYKSYDEYVNAQRSAYKKKFKNVWAEEDNIKFIARYLDKNIQPFIGLCHGVRQGHEVAWFTRHLTDCNVIGTDIGGELKMPIVLRHDFNTAMKELVGKFDFIYSNSFDHAYDPEKTFNVWADQIRRRGLIILEYDRRQEHTGEISQKYNKTDPVSITVGELIDLVEQWREGASVIDVLDMPVVTQEWRKAIVIEVRN